MSDIFSIGLSGLNAAQNGLSVTSNNIANVSTPGYNVQYLTQANSRTQYVGFGFLGQGVDTTNVIRTYNQYLVAQQQHATTNDSFFSTQLQQLSQINNMLNDSSISVNASMNSFFSALQTLSQDPGSMPSRQAVLSMGQALATNMTGISSQLQQLQIGANGQISASVTSINNLAQQIASYNGQIAALTGGNTTIGQPNDLLDKRDQAVLQLNKLISTSVSVAADGSYSISVGSGQTLVSGAQTNTLTTQQDPANPLNVQIGFTEPNGSTTILPNNLISGGQLGALLNYRDGPLLQTQQQLGTLAINFSAAMNYQNQLGKDRNGNPGQPMFADLSAYAANPQYAAANFQLLMGDPKLLATASNLTYTGTTLPPGTTSPTTMSGVWSSMPGTYAGQINASPPTFPAATSHPAYAMTGMTITAAASGTSVTMTATITGGSAPGTYNVVPDPINANGYKLVDNSTPPKDLGIGFQLSGSPVAGQVFNVGQAPNTPSLGDNSNLRQIIAQRNANLVSNQSYETYYSSTVTSIGNQTGSATLQSQSMKATLQQATTNVSNFSGVNLDQEASNLIKYQQAYQASGKIIQTAQTIFSTVLNMM
ncbi:flagellar hook-associated protein FlgK [Xenophilus sp. AP218F]|nr:flagellar hook-associated protein FlgK [Xenophilus sp. AP218F]